MVTIGSPSVMWTSQLPGCISDRSHSAGLIPSSSSETPCINCTLHLSVSAQEPPGGQEGRASVWLCSGVYPRNPTELACSWAKGILQSPQTYRSRVMAGDLTTSKERTMGTNSTGLLTG